MAARFVTVGAGAIVFQDCHMVEMAPVRSSNIVAIGHDSRANELHVKFKSGGMYVYHGVSASQHAVLMTAQSVGSHLHGVIKPAAAGVRKIL
jgi:hypothetical protein